MRKRVHHLLENKSRMAKISLSSATLLLLTGAKDASDSVQQTFVVTGQALERVSVTEKRGAEAQGAFRGEHSEGAIHE